MAKIIPFRAVRPSADKVSLVTCRTYDDYSPAELAAYLDYNPYSFLHVLNPAYAQLQKISAEKRFKLVGQKYHDFKLDSVLIKEEKPVLFLYEIQAKERQFTGIIAGASIADYQNNVIKRHEDTLEYRVELFRDYLHQTGFNTEPVLMTYRDNADLNNWIEVKKQTVPLYGFSTTNKENHTLWKIDLEEEINWIIKQFEQIGNLYIADGHHRCASAAALRNQDNSTDNEHLDYFMGFLIAESNVRIYEFNRVVHDLNGLSKEAFLEELSKEFIITDKTHLIWKPTKKFEFAMYLDGKFYSLELEGSPDYKNALESLDAQILYEKVLHPILGITDLRNDERIDYVPGNQLAHTMTKMIDDGDYQVGFFLYPIEISEIKELADNHLIMPPKSTYIEPKFRSGLVIYEI